MTEANKVELGDFQTPLKLAMEVTHFLARIGISPEVVLEPTCGRGSFIHAALTIFSSVKRIFGYDIQENYILEAQNGIAKKDRARVSLAIRNFFTFDLPAEFATYQGKVLVLGNPPWVTNSVLGAMGSENLPHKANFQRTKGFSAKTGKANFDISEWMIMQLLSAMQHHPGCLAMLCKMATARKVLRFAWINGLQVSHCSLHTFDAQEYFGASVKACLFIVHVQDGRREEFADIYQDFSFAKKLSRIGISNNELVADIDLYRQYQLLDGESCYIWRSGVKHDAVSIMELTRDRFGYYNGEHEPCIVEPQFIYPLFKSSDVANHRPSPRYFVLITQKTPSADTEIIRQSAPLLWHYLQSHASILDGRKSSIYHKRPRFCIFGIGPYSFFPWKVAVSGLYKNFRFVALGPFEDKPILLDDTCYSIPCQTKEEANFICSLLNSEICRNFLNAIVFSDAKRPITVDALNRVNLYQLAILLNCRQNAERYLSFAAEPQQALMVFESPLSYSGNQEIHV